jgi:hypothetical protein
LKTNFSVKMFLNKEVRQKLSKIELQKIRVYLESTLTAYKMRLVLHVKKATSKLGSF